MQRRREDEPSSRHLEYLVAPALRLLDRAPLVWLAGKQRRLRVETVEEASNGPVGRDSLLSYAERRHRTQPAIIRSARSFGGVVERRGAVTLVWVRRPNYGLSALASQS